MSAESYGLILFVHPGSDCEHSADSGKSNSEDPAQIFDIIGIAPINIASLLNRSGPGMAKSISTLALKQKKSRISTQLEFYSVTHLCSNNGILSCGMSFRYTTLYPTGISNIRGTVGA